MSQTALPADSLQFLPSKFQISTEEMKNPYVGEK